MIPVDQDQFGAPGSGEPLGNCFPACLATIMRLPLAAVPHFYESMKDPAEMDLETWERINLWLNARNWGLIAWNAPLSEVHVKSLGSGLVIGSGQSPRFPGVLHAVVGRFNDRHEWLTVHDPHPSRDGIIGEPTMIELLYRLES